MKNLQQILSYVKGLSCKTLNNDYYTTFGVTVYSDPVEPLFKFFNRVVIMEGIYSSITFTCNLTPEHEIRENTIEQINLLLERFFSKDYLKGRSLNMNAFYVNSEGEKQSESALIELMEENSYMRVILIIHPSKGTMRLSITDLEPSGVYLPVHAWLDKTIRSSVSNNDYKCDKATRIMKLGFTEQALLNNNYQRYELWFHEKRGGAGVIDESAPHMFRMQMFYNLSCDFLRDLYGREDAVYTFGDDPGAQSNPEAKHAVKWNLPEGEILLIRNSFMTSGGGRSLKDGACCMEFRITPRLLKAGTVDAKWIIDRSFRSALK